MTRWAALLLVAGAAGCSGGGATTDERGGGAALEQAALAQGLIDRDDAVEPTGAYGTGGDRVCVVPAGDGYRIGASVDYGEEQRCAATGTASGRGRLSVVLGGSCRFEARVSADGIAFPAALPDGCAALCPDRATLAALSAERLSGAVAEAAQMQRPGGGALCPGGEPAG